MGELSWAQEDALAQTGSTFPRRNWLRGRAYRFNSQTRCFVSIEGESISEERFEEERMQDANERLSLAIYRIASALSRRHS